VTIRYGILSQHKDTWSSDTRVSTTRVGRYLKHRVKLRGLKGGIRYGYEVRLHHSSHKSSWTGSQFTAATEETNWSPRVAFFGDLGWTNDQIRDTLGKEAFGQTVDAVLLYGDMVYWADGESENAFMRDVSSMTANGSVPMMVTPGNGDAGGNFSIYKGDFAMPGFEIHDSLFHSFNIGSVHVVGISTEAFYYQSFEVQNNMLKWFEEDLKRANQPDERSARPWIVVHYHRPAYSTNYGTGQHGDKYARNVFEPILYKYGVDLVLAGHVHVSIAFFFSSAALLTLYFYSAESGAHAPCI